MILPGKSTINVPVVCLRDIFMYLLFIYKPSRRCRLWREGGGKGPETGV